MTQFYADGKLKSLAAKRRTMHKRGTDFFTGNFLREGNKGLRRPEISTADDQFSQMEAAQGLTGRFSGEQRLELFLALNRFKWL